jgi:hypothetical protein
MMKRSHQPLAFMTCLRCVARPSTVARTLWLAVAALHGWLVLRRVATGELAGVMDALRALLCLGGVAYASLKFWRVATWFDSAPRRALAFAMILLLGHWLIAAPGQADQLFGPRSTLNAAAVLVMAPALGAALLMMKSSLSAARRARRAPQTSWPRLRSLDFDAFPLMLTHHVSFLFRRPPPELV